MLHWLDSALQFRHSTLEIPRLWEQWVGEGIRRFDLVSGGAPRDPYRT